MHRFFLGLLAVSLFTVSSASAGSSTIVEEWNEVLIASVQKHSQPPCLVARNLAILHQAIHQIFKESSEGDPRACSYAAHSVSVVLFPSERGVFDRLLKKQVPILQEAARTHGLKAAASILKSRENDGSQTTVHYDPDLSVGKWRRTTRNRPPELPHWKNVKPFRLGKATQFRPQPPPKIDSDAYKAALAQVTKLGSKTSGHRTKYQTESAQFWSDFSYTSTPPGRWNEIARSSIKGRKMTTQEKAKVFAILNTVLADAGIAAWDCKFHYGFWRPSTAIRSHDPKQVKEEQWESLLPSPSHPEFVSGHSAFSGAAAFVLTELLGDDVGPIVVTTGGGIVTERKYGNFKEIADEIGMSRIYGGIHYSFSNKAGLELGKNVAKFVLESSSD